MSYARVVPGRIAGTVSVTCAPDPASDATSVSVRYDLSSLGDDGTAFVAAFQARYEAFLQHWRQAILAVLGSGPGVPDGPAGPSLPAKP